MLGCRTHIARVLLALILLFQGPAFGLIPRFFQVQSNQK